MSINHRTAAPPPRRAAILALACLPALALLVACATATVPTALPATAAPPAVVRATAGAARYPDIVRATATRNPDGGYDFTVTVSSAYDRPERYADGWRLLAPDGRELAAHHLDHDHQDEQPFTRTQSGVRIPEGITRVTVQGRDQRSGYGGATAEVALPGR